MVYWSLSQIRGLRQLNNLNRLGFERMGRNGQGRAPVVLFPRTGTKGNNNKTGYSLGSRMSILVHSMST